MAPLSKDERRQLRLKWKGTVEADADDTSLSKTDVENGGIAINNIDDERFQSMMARNEDDLLQFVAKVNKVYQELLKKPAPFMTFVFCGCQSSGKSTIMERFLNSVLNIVQEGTGTRCPLDATCIHDSRCLEPLCELGGEGLSDEMKGKHLKVDEVFKRITFHNKILAEQDCFSTQPLYLIYRASNVQNMRFVDTPGIISNKSSGADNREDIKTILRHEMKKPNTKLCILLEPKEFATNPIIDFCDESFGGREKWIHDATFLMTKFDKQLEDSRSVTKANRFFQEFFENQCFPHLVITPTLANESLPPAELFQKRLELIQQADSYEQDKFEQWQAGHEHYRVEHSDNEELHAALKTRIGFQTAKDLMRDIMLKDTVARLPEVLTSLRSDLSHCDAERKSLLDKKEYSDKRTLQLVVQKVVIKTQTKILNYLDGDLQSSIKFPSALQTLEEEIVEEEESEWCDRELNFHSQKEDSWRDRIAKMDPVPEEIQAKLKFLGGKQYQRALEFFRIVMIDSLPDPYELKSLVPNSTGYLSGGLQHENWERAMVEITKVSLKEVSHPGINYLIKHVGSIFRRLFLIALADIKQGEELSAKFKMIPGGVEKHLICEFDDVLWDLMMTTSQQVHTSMEPMYSSIDPTLPTFHTSNLSKEPDGKKISDSEMGWIETIRNRISALASCRGSAAKDFLKSENRRRATHKRSFLPDQRSAMLTNEETDTILQRSFEYIVGLMEFNLHVYKFQLNHYLYNGFKEMLMNDFVTRMNEVDWDSLIQVDPSIDIRLQELDEKIKGLTDSLHDVQRMQRSF